MERCAPAAVCASSARPSTPCPVSQWVPSDRAWRSRAVPCGLYVRAPCCQMRLASSRASEAPILLDRALPRRRLAARAAVVLRISEMCAARPFGAQPELSSAAPLACIVGAALAAAVVVPWRVGASRRRSRRAAGRMRRHGGSRRRGDGVPDARASFLVMERKPTHEARGKTSTQIEVRRHTTCKHSAGHAPRTHKQYAAEGVEGSTCAAQNINMTAFAWHCN
eukprot:scaffold73052_cov103-Phaeocystis_antarctica.AAC.3